MIFFSFKFLERKMSLSVILMALQALLHASVACHRKLVVEWVPAGDLEEITEYEVSLNFCIGPRSILIICNHYQVLNKMDLYIIILIQKLHIDYFVLLAGT